ncbi:MAG TPA: 50S ribosomal protein L11 methyltransferase, partial [Steroidobacteraceae bacterium]
TKDNATRNAVDDRLQTLTVEDLSGLPADAVLANILAEPLEQLASRLAALVAPGGAIVLSGILTDQAARLASVYAAWFDMDPIATRENWARLSGIKRR